MWTPEAKLNFVSQSMCEKKKLKRCHLHIKTVWNQLKIVVFPSCWIKLQLFQAEHCLISTSQFRSLWTARIKCVNACDPCQHLSCFVSLPLKQRTWNCTVSARKQETKKSLSPPLIIQGVLRPIKARVDKHLSNPADHSSVVIIRRLLPVTVITTALDELKHRWWWETKQK